MVESVHAVHRTIVVVDVEGFGHPRRTLPHQVGTRAGLYRVVDAAFRAAGVPWEACYHEDRGDSVFVLVPPDYLKAPLVEVLPGALAEALRGHNDTSPAAQRTRLRVAVHAGEVAFDRHGTTSTALTTAFRLLDAPALRTALAGSPGLVGLIVSRWVFDEVVRHSAVLDPGTFRPVPLRVKEVRDLAWIALPDHPYPADPAVLDRPVPDEPAPDDEAGRTGRAPAADVVTPRQLPGPPAHFVGRERHLADLDRALPRPDDGTCQAVPITALSGVGGIGKTWLALHWAHLRARHFPDGHLFVDLRGFSPHSEPLHPAVAVRRFLDALGVPPGRLPVDLDAQAALYRSLVADRRMLVVLDNAASADQVVPLLPGTPTCAVLVTGRRTPASLIDRHGARHLRLDVLSAAESRALLTTRLGSGPVEAEPDATDELIALCGRHCLALSITARHAAARTGVPLAELAAELRELGLGMMDDDDPAASLPTVLSWSLRHLTDRQRTTFALLGIAPGADIDLHAAASLVAEPLTDTRRALHALEEASLVERRAGGRYAMHDLVRAYATSVADDLPASLRRAALDRAIDFYLHTAHAAQLLLEPRAAAITPDPPAPGVAPRPPADRSAAMSWLDTEHAHLIAAQRAAADHGRHQTVCHLAMNVAGFHRRRGHLHDNLGTFRVALDAAAHLPDPTTAMRVHRHLGRAHARLGQHDQATEHLHRALDLAEQHGATAHQAAAHQELAQAWEQRGDTGKAFDHAQHALDRCRALGNRSMEADALSAVGWYAALLGEHDAARRHCHAALVLHREHDNPNSEAHTLDTLGLVELRAGNHRQAVEDYRQALTLFRSLGHTYDIVGTQERLGHPEAALGRLDQARTTWREAENRYRDQGRHDDAARVRRLLDGLGPTGGSG
ncbi:tetratricopeptide repeat protein [Actinosynnema sp. NPDC050436]|uniref:ATP-binding protein n=1 Tax=Actinosynnema sp. NPDC050436 TaxID=3155659 RepID=UPI00340C4E9D